MLANNQEDSPSVHHVPVSVSERSFPIVLDHVSRRYHTLRGSTWALRDVSLRIEPGIFGLLGRNGAGKTTLLQMLATLLRPSEGTVRIGPYDATRQRREIREHLGYLPQEHGFYPSLTVEETLRYLGTLGGIEPLTPQVRRALAAVHLTDRAHARVRTLSGGMRRRLGLAQALLGDPPILIVDEPTAGLDPVEQQRFRTLLGALGAQGNRTIILSTHIVEDVANIANYLAVLELGHLAFLGTVQELAARARGQTWQWQTTADTVERVRATRPVIVTSLVPVASPIGVAAGQVLAHSVGPQPAPEAVAREPLLEDGYFSLIGGDEERNEHLW